MSTNTNTSTKKSISIISPSFSEGTILIVFLALFVLLSVAVNGFFTANNLSNLVRQTSINGVIALGMTFVIVSAGIDLSVGSVVGFAGMFAAILMTQAGMNAPLSVIIAIIAGTLVGVINGILIYDGKVPPFIATLGTMTVFRGVIMLISGARMVSGLPASFLNLAQMSILGMPSLFVIWVITILISAFIISKTRFGRNIYAIGSNVEAARLSGINIRTNMYMIYGYSALMSSIAGIMLVSRLANGIPTAGSGYELDAIAAAVIGGASLNGAEGSIVGTVVGAMLMSTLRNAGDLLGIDPFILQILIGALIVAAVLIDQVKKQSK
ncbi:ABC transporter permease [Thermoanaerobacterium sp. DL9XJH110]|uniref:ABC transporter permease n=1 Tax=Thermoanaerobacterium sp. DL9XJH110 TaxID=3386643 RepID=UPI003BB4EEE6